jgi:hypothetical protein
LRTIILVLALLLAPLVLPVGSAEGPTDGRCDDTGRLVCAAANAGANVTCTLTPTHEASCDWTAGYLWEAYSPVGLPGDATMSTLFVWTTCITGHGCHVIDDDGDATCSWVAILTCGGSVGPLSGSVGPSQLALGGCLTVTIVQSITVEASVVSGGPLLATAAWTDLGEAAGSVCAVDDGRD